MFKIVFVHNCSIGLHGILRFRTGLDALFLQGSVGSRKGFAWLLIFARISERHMLEELIYNSRCCWVLHCFFVACVYGAL